MVVLAASLCNSTLGAEDEAPPQTAQEVFARMDEARKAVKTARYEIKQRNVYSEPVFYDDDDPGRIQTGAREIVVPAGTATISEITVITDGEKYLYKYSMPMITMIDKGITVSSGVDIWDGEKALLYDTAMKRLIINGSPRGSPLMPENIYLFHFGLWRWSRPVFWLAGVREFQDRPLYLLIRERDDGRMSVWIDPERDWTIARLTCERLLKRPEKNAEQGNTPGEGNYVKLLETDIEYAQDKSGLWRPARIAQRVYRERDEELVGTTERTWEVKKADINEPLSEKEFWPDVPDNYPVVYQEGTPDMRFSVEFKFLWDRSLSPDELDALIDQNTRTKIEESRRKLNEMLGGPAVGDPAPEIKVEGRGGETFSIEDCRGKYLLLVFCPSGLENLLDAQFIIETEWAVGGDERLAIVALQTDALADIKAAHRWIQMNDLTWRVLFIHPEEFSSISDNYGVVNRCPIFLIGPDGRLIARNLWGEGIKEAVVKALQGE
jgi:hypothetical protein